MQIENWALEGGEYLEGGNLHLVISVGKLQLIPNTACCVNILSDNSS